MIYCIDSITDQWVLNRNLMNSALERLGRPAGVDAGSVCLFQCVLVRTVFLLDHLPADHPDRELSLSSVPATAEPFPAGARHALHPPFLYFCPAAQAFLNM